MSSENPRNKDDKNSEQDSKHSETKHSGGAASLQVPPTPNQEAKSNNQKDIWFYFKFAVEILTLLFLIRYTVLTGQSVRIAHDSFNVTNRPYVGIEQVVRGHIGKSDSGAPIKSEVHTPETTALTFGARIKNFGIAPARNALITWKVIVGDEEMGGRALPSKPSTIFPTEELNLGGTINGPNYVNVMSGAKALQFDLHIIYDGPTEHYDECISERYSPDANVFFDLGPCQK